MHTSPFTPRSSLLLPALSAFSLLALILSSPAFSQTVATGATTATTTSATTDNNSEEIIELLPFEVSATAQTGYIASESMTGSRMPTKVIDLPYAIDIVTSEFLSDFAISDESYIVEGGIITFDQDAGGESLIRGIRTTGQLYNGFWIPGGTPLGGGLKDRTEVLKGPSAGIYGQTTPGGIQNTISKQPKFTRLTKLNTRLGSYNERFALVETTGPISKKTAYLAILTVDDRQFMQPWRRNTTDRLAASLVHKFDLSSQLKIEFTGARQRNKAPANRIPYYYDSSTGRYEDLAWELAPTSGTGPKSWDNLDVFSLFAIFEKRINNVFSFRLGSNYIARHRQYFNVTTLTKYDPDPTHGTPTSPTQPNAPYLANFSGLSRTQSASTSYSAPGYQKDNQDNGGIQGDILARYFLGHGKSRIECRTLLTFDFSSRYQYQEKWAMPQEISNPVPNPSTASVASGHPDPRVFPWNPATIGTLVSADYFWKNYWLPVIDPLNPASSIYVDLNAYPQYDIYHVPDFDKAKWVMSTKSTSRRDVLGFMLRQQMILWGRVIVYGSLRYDDVSYTQKATTYAPWVRSLYPQYDSYWLARITPSREKWNSTALTPSTGFNYRPKPWLSLFANYSTSFNPSSQLVSGSMSGVRVLPNETARGLDYGIKFSLNKDKLTGTLCGFYINQDNMSVIVEDPFTFAAVRVAGGSVVSRGFEGSANYFVTRSWSFKAGYYYTDAHWINVGRDQDLAGRRKANIPPHIVTFVTKYAFLTKPLRGLSVFGAYRYTSSCRADDGGAVIPTGFVIIPPGSNNGLRNLMVPAASIVDLGATYGFKIPAFGRGTKFAVQFNVKNVFNKLYVTQSRGVADERSCLLSLSASF